MWIDYKKSKRAVERKLYTCRDYVLKGYFSIKSEDDGDGIYLGLVIPHYQNRFANSSPVAQIGSSSNKENKNLKKLLNQEEQYEWLATVIKSINKLDGKYREVIIYHYLKGYTLSQLKKGVVEHNNEIKIVKSHDKNRIAIMKLMLYMDDCLVPYDETDINQLVIKDKIGAINFVEKKK